MATAVASLPSSHFPVSIMHQPSPSPSTSTNSLSSSSQSQAASSPPSSNPPTRSSSGTSIAKMVANNTKAVPRSRIRFAPLPDPRRAVLVTEDGEELPIAPPPGCTDATELTSISIRDIPISSLPSSSNVSSEGHGSPLHLPSQLEPTVAQSEVPTTPTTTIPMRPETPSNSTPKKKSWLTPWKKRSSSSSTGSLTPTSSIHADDPSMNTINLIRQTSRESTASTSNSGLFGGLGLQRWSSTQSSRPTGTPMTRTFSAQSANLPPTKKKTAQRPSSATGSRGPRGQRMLNGRVYGANKNPFANVRDTDPDFVEWGYGGMGSNQSKSGAPGSDWSKVQGNGSVFHSPNRKESLESSAAVAATTDGDDGSGMGWVKKRREQREREKKEREERESADTGEKEKPKEGVGVDDSIPTVLTEEPESLPTSADHTPTPSRRPTLNALTPLVDDTPSSTAPQPRPSTDSVAKVTSPTHSHTSSPSQEFTEHHVLKAVNLPPTTHRRSSSHFSLADSSKPAPVASSSDSSSESESEAEEDKDDDDDDDDEDEEDDLGHNGCQIKGAGVEKFTRHKE
ncbi:hypothetical protein DL96DRAFT_478282 [Flagelloscypha sp. PMI_526]|nr:hypothetical protein DL96DRAFT_478282 [Flagelloscypha sp. PMI_526]